MIHFSRTNWTKGPNLQINCKECRGKDVEAFSFEREERIMFCILIPLPVQRELHVVCEECEADLLSDLPLDKLADLDASDIEKHLFYRVSLIVKTLAVASL